MLAFFLITGNSPLESSTSAGGGDRYTTAEADLNPLLGFATGSDFAQLSRQNVRLGAELAEHWDQARRAGQSRGAFGDGVFRLLDDFSRNAIRGGDDALREDYWRLRVAELAWLEHNEGPEVCDRNAQGQDRELPPQFSPDIAARRRAVLQRSLAEDVAPTPAVGGLDYAIEGDIMRAGASRAFLRLDDFTTALGGGGDPASRCRARLGFIEAVLALPGSRRAAMLRNMSAGL